MHSLRLLFVASACVFFSHVCIVAIVCAQDAEQSAGSVIGHDAPQARGSRSQRGERRVFRDHVSPHWTSDSSRFWYRNDLKDGAREFVLVDVQQGKRELAFDHAAVAEAIGNGATASQLPIDRLEVDPAGKIITLVGSSKRWTWDTEHKTLSEVFETAEKNEPARPAVEPERSADRPLRTGAESELTFDNRSPGPVEVFWISGEGTRQSYGKIAPGTRKQQHTFGGHRWLVVNERGERLGEFVANDTPSEVVIDGRRLETPQTSTSRSMRRGEHNSRRSPDGKWLAWVKNSNVFIKKLSSTSDEDVDDESNEKPARDAANKDDDTGRDESGSESEEVALSTDGQVGHGYSQLVWSPDSQAVVAFRTKTAEIEKVHLVRSSPEGGGRAELVSRPYALPGDEFPRHEVNIFRLEDRRQIKPEVDLFEHERQRPRIRWSRDGQRFTYEQTDRGHRRFRLIEVDAATGRVRNLIDEQPDTFVWTAHTENQSYAMVNWLERTDEIIYVTEKSGWRHMVLIDPESGMEKNAITHGSWIVRGIERIDEANRQVWFRASGCFEQDPYFIHYGRVDFDGSNLTWLTEGDGTHSIEYSPDRRFVIDTYSRVDMAPVTELRSANNGQLLCELESADTNDLEASGWSPPQVFSAKGRDGQTDIWGIICRPRDFDPGKTYPVIEDIYAGPHGSFVPKSFSASQRYESLTSLGFIVVKVDGMGTANRSKAFHDVCWQNVKDAGFEDRILWMKAAAEKVPQLNLTRVGIYGTSAGGQNAAAAVLFHPEFYKVAVAACGCHDNRMDKASWNEQWMGYPVGPHYSKSSNIDNAARLRGKLLLIVGEMDTNVPPESTMRFANALIQAEKDVDLLVIPNAGHGMGGSYGQRRMHDFFLRHLLSQDPPDRNAP